MATITVPSRNYDPGLVSRSVNNIPSSQKGVKISFTRESWPIGEVARLTIVGNDALGNPFAIGPFNLSGGIVNGKDGLPINASSCSWEWPGENDGQGGRREIKITDVTANFEVLQTLRTAITIETF